jgi:flavorubredoxin
MSKILVFYYSRTGNTEKMAQAVAEGAQTAGAEVDLNYFLDAQELGTYDAILVGTPTYHHDMPLEIKKLFEEAATKNVVLKGKIGAAFGSFGWSGEAPGKVVEILKNKFEMQVPEKVLLSKYVPDGGMLEQCRALGKRLAENLIRPA